MNFPALGIDAGSVSVSLVRLTEDATDIRYASHHGRIAETVRSMLDELGPAGPERLMATSTAAPVLRECSTVDTLVASIHAARARRPDVRSLLVVGGERFARVLFSESGEYEKAWRNSSCAAGTGSFLDQQARRLGLSGSEELSSLALSNRGAVPVIASRCSVFAKTDIIHAQQEGYTLPEICDGLCLGLARNLLDTLGAGRSLPEPLLVAGGVARNGAVLRHIAALTGSTPVIDELSHLYGAYGAALLAAADSSLELHVRTVDEILAPAESSRSYFYAPLDSPSEGYPDFESGERYLFSSERMGESNPVEVEIFGEAATAGAQRGFLGIDIGSTSTKGVFTDAEGTPLVGLYTRTAGQPLAAVQGLFEAFEDLSEHSGQAFEVLGATTTGSGRKFVGTIIGADLIVDEITAHARAACSLNPAVDTIIEIGGQDAKFTTVRDGMVTFSHMNTVCAAGTGSFLEEQAARLDVPLSSFAGLAEGAASPLASDRCTVFMERDLNHLLQRGYRVSELLAAALHSVRENYFQKVAVNGTIGDHICFQGATAKNRALVAAFEQKLGKRIAVSRFCHLAGALGAALLLMADPPETTTFRGVGLHREEIPVRSERCELCANRCRLRIAEVGGEEVAFGFLCGRDYQTDHYVDSNRSGFDLMRERRRAVRRAGAAESPGSAMDRPSIGIPAALHLFADFSLWEVLFTRLGFTVVRGDRAPDSVQLGREASAAEFCTPVRDLLGQVSWLLDRADLVFLPDTFRNPASGKSNCYYTQYAAVLAGALDSSRRRIISPLIEPGRDAEQKLARELAELLSPALGRTVGPGEVAEALDRAEQTRSGQAEVLRALYGKYAPGEQEVQRGALSVVLVGRPYTILAPHMNKRIPEIFGSLGVRVFFQDMVPAGEQPDRASDPVSWFPWHHASDALDAAEWCAAQPGVYPVYVTSFKCSPDSFAIEYFKEMLDRKRKPYLILQLDEHDSSVGYETRIEAAVAAFRNHARRPLAAAVSCGGAGAARHSPDGRRPTPFLRTPVREKTLLVPSWNSHASPLLAAALRGHGFDARVLPETPELIERSMGRNSGQCIPVHVIAEEAAEFVRTENLDPDRTALWMIQSDLACNICLYPRYLQTLLRSFGDGLERIEVHQGAITFQDLAPTLPVDVYFSFLFGGMIANLETRIRPYELHAGHTDAAGREASALLVDCFERRITRASAAKRVAELYRSIQFDRSQLRPKAAVFGDLYVRDNLIFNQDLPRSIEEAGGEAVVTSYVDYVKIVAPSIFQRWRKQGKLGAVAANRALLTLLETLERLYIREFVPIVGPPASSFNRRIEEELRRFGLRLEHEGESADNVLKILHLLRRYPDIALFVEASPAFCCPALVTEAMSDRIERIAGVPVVSITYDGTSSGKNDVIRPYLAFRNNRDGEPAPERR